MDALVTAERVRLLHFPPADNVTQAGRVRAQWSEEIPYGLEISREGGVPLRALLPDRAARLFYRHCISNDAMKAGTNAMNDRSQSVYGVGISL